MAQKGQNILQIMTSLKQAADFGGASATIMLGGGLVKKVGISSLYKLPMQGYLQILKDAESPKVKPHALQILT